MEVLYIYTGWAKKNELSFLKFNNLSAKSSNAMQFFFNFVDNFDVFIFLNFQSNRLSKFLEILKIVEVSRNNFLSGGF